MVLSAGTRRLFNPSQSVFYVRAAVCKPVQPYRRCGLSALVRTLRREHSTAFIPTHRRLSTAGGSGDNRTQSHDPPHFKLILPDIGQTSKTGNLTRWRKAEGDVIKNGDVVCEVEMDQFNVGMEVDDKGYLARILVPAGTRGVPAGEALAVFVYEEQYKDAFSSLPRYHTGGGGASETSAGAEEGEMAIDGVSLLKFLHKLVRNGSIKDKEFAQKLQTLARHEDKQLLRVFEASFEGEGPRREEDFDLEFFLEEGRGVVHDMEAAMCKAGEEGKGEPVEK